VQVFEEAIDMAATADFTTGFPAVLEQVITGIDYTS